jgi:predicted patatin/cPLA2 family phospholipase
MTQSKAPQTTLEQQDSLWKARLLSLLKKDVAAPAFCIQGGGARGAWEAGVLAGLLKAGPNTTPSSIWGTSAGALNALWSRDPSIQAEPTRLLYYWTTLAHRLIAVVAAGVIYVCAILWMFWSLPIEVKVAVVALAGLALFLLDALARRRILIRLPGLISPALARLIVPRPKSVAPGGYVYTCVSDVDSEILPDHWGNSMRGWFRLDRESSDCLAEDMSGGEMVDAFHVAVASASIPIAVHPARLAGMRLLDGGLVANLPAGFILSNGALGGAYVLCVVPRDVGDLSNSDPIDHRTLRFLFDLRDEQAKHRSAAAVASSWSGPAHTHIPVFVLSPKEYLKSGLVRFWPSLLRREFSQGVQEAKTFSAALEAFSRGDVHLTRGYLLEQVLEGRSAPVGKPSRSAWYKWANTHW